MHTRRRNEPKGSLLAEKGVGRGESGNERVWLEGRIRALLEGQPFAVLCTQGGGEPYGSLVAFASSAQLGSVVFCILATTRIAPLARRRRLRAGSPWFGPDGRVERRSFCHLEG